MSYRPDLLLTAATPRQRLPHITAPDLLIFLLKNILPTRLKTLIRLQLVKPIPFTLEPRRILQLFRLGLKILNHTLNRKQVVTQVRRKLLKRLINDRNLQLSCLPIFLKVLIKLLQRLLVVLLINCIIGDQGAETLLALESGDLFVKVGNFLINELAGVD